MIRVHRPCGSRAPGSPKIWLLGFGVTLTAICHAAPPIGTSVSFLACPIARDTGPDSDLCFFASQDGVLYALDDPADFGEPQLRHKVLVEGTILGGGLVCGGTQIEGRVSVMPEIDANCDQVVPFAGDVREKATKRQDPQDPRQSLRPQLLQVPPAPPFDRRKPRATVEIIYPFDSTRGSGPDMAELKELAKFAVSTEARRVEVVGRQSAARLSNGSVLLESEGLARERAEKVAGILEALGVRRRVVTVSWQSKPESPTGNEDWRHRSVRVTVIRE